MFNIITHKENEEQNHNEILLYTPRMHIIKEINKQKWVITIVGEDEEKLEHFSIAGGDVNSAATLENGLGSGSSSKV